MKGFLGLALAVGFAVGPIPSAPAQTITPVGSGAASFVAFDFGSPASRRSQGDKTSQDGTLIPLTGFARVVDSNGIQTAEVSARSSITWASATSGGVVFNPTWRTATSQASTGTVNIGSHDPYVRTWYAVSGPAAGADVVINYNISTVGSTSFRPQFGARTIKMYTNGEYDYLTPGGSFEGTSGTWVLHLNTLAPPDASVAGYGFELSCAGGFTGGWPTLTMDTTAEFDFTITPVPEPASVLVVAAAGLVACRVLRRRRRGGQAPTLPSAEPSAA